MTKGMLAIYSAKTSVEGLINLAKIHPSSPDGQIMKRMMTMASLMDRTRRRATFEERDARFEFDLKVLQERKYVPAGV